ncbi:MAG TPA: hypothetical protein VE781_05505, partial [Kineosporiaceae bacterium]|nr:hypothetical protein [Kineosporiaceae bacterium]
RVALDGDGVPLRGTVAGLPGAGGALTAGELTGAQPVRHALALLVPAAVLAQGTRWPAVRTDGTQAAAGSGLRLGALLALTPAVAARLAPASPAARRLVAALRDHGAYVAGVADGDAVELRVARTPGTPADAVAVPATVRAALTPALRALAVVDDNAPGTPGGAGARRPDAAPAPSPSATPRAAAPTPEASPPPAVVGTAAAQASTSRPTTPRESAPAGALAAIAVLAVGLLVAGLRAGRSAARLFTT